MHFTGEELEQMMAEMTEAHASIANVETQFNEVSATAVSKDRMISATADAHGVLSGLKLTGQSWREISAKELTAKIVDVVSQAQAEARQRGAALFADIAPAGVDPTSGLPEGVEMEAMLQGLVAQFGEATHER